MQAQAPQQAALAASGVLKARGAKQHAQGTGSNTSSSSGCSTQAATGTVWCTGSLTADDVATAAALPAVQRSAESSLTPAGPAMLSSGWPAAPGSRGLTVSSVFAAMDDGPLLPPGPALAQGAAFAGQLLAEAAEVQAGLGQLHAVAWPGLVEASIREGWAEQ
jgi:hypothetical protein